MTVDSDCSSVDCCKLSGTGCEIWLLTSNSSSCNWNSEILASSGSYFLNLSNQLLAAPKTWLASATSKLVMMVASIFLIPAFASTLLESISRTERYFSKALLPIGSTKLLDATKSLADCKLLWSRICTSGSASLASRCSSANFFCFAISAFLACSFRYASCRDLAELIFFSTKATSTLLLPRDFTFARCCVALLKSRLSIILSISWTYRASTRL